MIRKVMFLFVLFMTVSLVYAQLGEPIPNPNQPDDIVVFTGSAAISQPISAAPIPEHPYMSRGEGSNIHNDAYMSDTYTRSGPLGVNLTVTSVNLNDICATITFDGRGHLITTCLDLDSAALYLLDAHTLTLLDQIELPYREVSLTSLEFPAGSYFYLDEQGRVVLPTVGNHVWIVGVTEAGAFALEHDFDLSAALPAADEINSIMPDFDGLLWFTTAGGIVGTLDRATSAVATLTLDQERVANSLAVDETGGVFIVTDTALYRFDAGAQGQPTLTWREPYDRGARLKPGQASQGSGTTPTLMGSDYVAITDNADPRMRVLVYRRAAEIAGDRLVCAVPVFEEDRSATENSLIATDRSLIVENNYGYQPLNPLTGLSETGMTRIDMTEDGGCEIVWTADVRVPSVVSKLSLGSGLIYTYTRDEARFARGSWFLTALDYATGAVAWSQYIGTGADFNNNYAALYIGEDGTVYVGVTSGIVAARDNP